MNYQWITVYIDGSDDEYDIEVPGGLLPRAGDSFELIGDQFPEQYRGAAWVTRVSWYEATHGRYRPIVVLRTGSNGPE